MSLVIPSMPPLLSPPHKPRKNNKKTPNRGGSRLLITVNVVGSAGPIRFLVNEEELVASVIQTSLKSYAREGRLPVLGSDLGNFLLYCTNGESDALSPLDPIGSHGGRNFLLCKKQQAKEGTDKGRSQAPTGVLGRKGNGGWKTWFNKSLTFKISSH